MTNNDVKKLELTWVGKDEALNLEPRLLLLEPEHSEGDINADNMLIHGDNLLALKALEQQFQGQVKCIYIDPPYNTGNAFEHYDDMQEHSLWLNLMRHRLEILKNLLHTEGSIWVSIDDDESHYLKVMMDGVFGRKNFVANVIWEKKYSPQNDAKWLSDSHDHILVYAKNKDIWRPNLLPRGEKQDKAYKNADNDSRGLWKASDLTRAEFRERDFYSIETPSGKLVFPSKGRSWSRPKIEIERLRADNRLWFGVKGDAIPSLKRFLTEVKEGVVTKTIWNREEVGDNQEAKQEVKKFDDNNIFATPKPERLIERVLTLATKENDLVLDSFLGSGTTAAVAHKMGRRWIGIELGEHAYTHCLPRLRKVVRGEDLGGITKSVAWTGGGGFKTYRLASSLLTPDANGMLTFNPEFTDDMTAEAVAKLEGYTFQRDPSVFWQQSKGLDNSYLYVTKLFITKQWLDELALQLPADVSLLICCPAYVTGCETADKRIKLKKIPQAFQWRYQFAKDDYSLKVESVMPSADAETGGFEENTEGVEAAVKKSAKRKNEGQATLF